MIGTTVSHYRILEKLGEGGMGVVYKAQDLKLDRFVALKFLPKNIHTSPDEMIRFEQEARAISALSHPNIATIYDLDEANGEKFLVLEYLPKGTLKSRLKELRDLGTKFSISEVVEIGIQIAEGLVHSHREGIIHRDIKTENMMLTKEGKIKITDFGIAKLRAGTSHLTKTGSTVGTAGYMSPEQIRGEEVSSQTDIFSLGIVMYELITGQFPFKGDHEAALTYEIVNIDPPPLSDLRSDIPPELQRIVNGALEKNLAKRYQNAEAIVSDLQQLQKGLGLGKEFTIGQFWRLWKSSKKKTIAVAVPIALVLAAIAYFYLTQIKGSTEVASVAILYMKNLGQESDEAYCYGITQDLIVDIANAGRVRVIPMKNVLSLVDSNITIESTAKKLHTRYVMESSFRRIGNMIRITANIIDASTGNTIWGDHLQAREEEASSLQGELAEAIISSLNISATPSVRKEITSRRTENPAAYEYYMRAKYIFEKKKGKEDVVIARGLFEKAMRLDSSLIAAHLGFGDTYEIQGEYDPALRIYEKTLSLRHGIGQRIDEASCLSRIGRIHWQKRDQQKALDYYERSLAIYVELGDLSGQSSVLNGIGNIHSNQGNLEKALQTYEQGLIIARNLQDRPNEAVLLGNIGIEFMNQGEFAEALDYYRRSLVLYEELEDNVSISRTTFNLGELYRRLGDTVNALQHFNRCLGISRDLGVKFGVIISLSAIGAVYSDQGEYVKAVKYLEDALPMSKALGAQSLEATTSTLLGICLARNGDFIRSMEILKDATVIFDQIGENPGIMWATSWQGVAQIGIGRKEDARKTARRLQEMLKSYPKPDDYVQILWNLSQIYSFLGDAEAASKYVLAVRSEVEARAQKITDKAMRENYLKNVKENREIIAATEKNK